MGLSLSHGTAICWLRDAAGTSLFFTHMFALPRTATAVERKWWWSVSACAVKRLDAPVNGNGK